MTTTEDEKIKRLFTQSIEEAAQSSSVSQKITDVESAIEQSRMQLLAQADELRTRRQEIERTLRKWQDRLDVVNALTAKVERALERIR